jgi:PAS domain S-box-containing protein
MAERQLEASDPTARIRDDGRDKERKVLLGSSELYEQVVRSAQEGVIVFDVERRYVVWNPFMERAMGVLASELLGKRTEDVFPFLECVGIVEAQLRALEGESIVLPDVPIMPPASGRRHWFSLHYSPLHDLRGGIAGAICIVRDITERKSVEEQLRQSQKMEAIGRLAGGVAHDFNNLLTAINGYAAIALEGTPADSGLREPLNEILSAGERAAELTRQLLAHSRKQPVAPQIWDLNEIVSNIEKMLRRLLGEDVQLVTALDRHIGAVRVDRGQIEQVLMNLAVNARDAMAAGGTLRIETRAVSLDNAQTQLHPDARPGPHSMVTVSDTGAGMSEEVMARLFEPFFTTKEPGRGTGLGLSTVYGIVKQSGGLITVDSEPGHGSTFRVFLPAAEPVDREVGLSLPQAASASPGHEAVLVVEDQEVVRALVSQVLRRRGYEVHAASDAAEALRLLAAGLDVALVVTDVVMPDMSGRALGRRLRESFPTLPVLYTSGHPLANVVDEDIPAHRFLMKPFSPVELLRKVRQILDGC